MNTKDLTRIISKIEKESSLFSKKGYLDTLSFPAKILGREKQAEELVRYFLGYRQGYVIPLISVYGRSGSGKSAVVKFVCENLKEISYSFVNLRKSKTVFGAANLILAELGKPNLKSAQGINLAIEKIGSAIEDVLKKSGKKLFVLVLDESDVLFYDRRGKPSDFIYKLIVLEESLREKNLLLCIVTISNNVISDYELDDRVRSRIGSTEIFFEPYSKDDVVKILKERANEAFSKKIDDMVLEYCATRSSQEHGDARRAIDLLRVAADIASSKGEDISRTHVDLASDEIQIDRVTKVLSSASHHLKVVCHTLAKAAVLNENGWQSTSSIYRNYCNNLDSVKPLTYRRVSELLTEMENSGLAVSHTGSRGRHGYGTEYKLTTDPVIVGKACFPDKWIGGEPKMEFHDLLDDVLTRRKSENKRFFPFMNMTNLQDK